MQAARFEENGKPFAIEDIDYPSVGPNDVLVKIQAAGVCGSDVHYRDSDPDFSPAITPITMGHEGAGEVTETGSEVDHLETGDRVVLNYIISCGECPQCVRGYDNRCQNRRSLSEELNGTFAECVVLPSRCAIKTSKDVPYEWSAIASCAVSTAYHAVQRANLQASETVVVFGIGGVGQHAVMWADFFGAGKIIAVDIDDDKLLRASEFGADVLINGKSDDILDEIMGETSGYGSDISIECSGTKVAMEQCIESISGENPFASGRAISVGLQHEPFNAATYMGLREGSLMVSGDHTRQDLLDIVSLMEMGKIDLDKSITHREDLDDVNKAIDRLEDGEEATGRTVLQIQN